MDSLFVGVLGFIQDFVIYGTHFLPTNLLIFSVMSGYGYSDLVLKRILVCTVAGIDELVAACLTMVEISLCLVIRNVATDFSYLNAKMRIFHSALTVCKAGVFVGMYVVFISNWGKVVSRKVGGMVRKDEDIIPIICSFYMELMFRLDEDATALQT